MPAGLAAAVALAAVAPGCRSDRTGPNIVLLVVDTLRADHLGCYGYPRDTSPNLDRLAGQSMVFDNAFTPIGITFPSHASLLTGLPPQQTGALRNYGILDERITTLAEILHDHGYATAAVVGTAVLKESRNLSQGFDRYFGNFRSGNPAQGPARGARMGFADDANEFVYSWLQNDCRPPFFLFVNYYDVHSPAVRRDRYRVSFAGDDPEFARYLADRYAGDVPAETVEQIGLYDQAIAYTDDMIGRLIEKLRSLGLSDDTVIVVTSDHGQGLGQHNGYWSHGFYLYDEITRVPLIVRLPGSRSGTRIEAQVMLTDLAPTLCELAGIGGDFDFPGRSLLAPEDLGDRPVFAMRTLEDEKNEPVPGQFSVRTPEEKIIYTLEGETTVFDLADDPYELHGRPSAGSARERNLVKNGYDWYRPELIKRMKPWSPDRETEEELRALGYVR